MMNFRNDHKCQNYVTIQLVKQDWSGKAEQNDWEVDGIRLSTTRPCWIAHYVINNAVNVQQATAGEQKTTFHKRSKKKLEYVSGTEATNCTVH